MADFLGFALSKTGVYKVERYGNLIDIYSHEGCLTGAVCGLEEDGVVRASQLKMIDDNLQMTGLEYSIDETREF